MMKSAANGAAWAIGRQQRNGFHIRRVVWGLLMATMERRADEEIRAANIMVEIEWKPRHAKPKPKLPPRDLTVTRVDEHGVAYNAAGESIGMTGTTGNS